jgi:lysophospholipid acyltransferase (LPLAT)-like uncharacterized protein
LDLNDVTRTILQSNLQEPHVYYFWHCNLCAAPMLRPLHKGRPMYGLMSASRDGAWLEALVKWFKVDAIRGSSTWRGDFALKELDQRKHAVCDIVITPDGPKGPRCQCKVGSLKWAWTHRYPVIALHFEMPHAWQLRSWDRFRIPKPFSTIHVKAYAIPTAALELEAFQAAVQRYL